MFVNGKIQAKKSDDSPRHFSFTLAEYYGLIKICEKWWPKSGSFQQVIKQTTLSEKVRFIFFLLFISSEFPVVFVSLLITQNSFQITQHEHIKLN